MRSSFSFSSFVSMAGLLLLAGATGAYAAEAARQPARCGLSTLQGNYGFSVSGTAATGVGDQVEQIVGVALTRFDGKGNLTQVDNIHGSITGTAVDRPAQGTYTLERNCSGTMTLFIAGIPVPIELRIVVVDGGKEVRTVVVFPPPNLVTSVGRSVQ